MFFSKNAVLDETLIDQERRQEAEGLKLSSQEPLEFLTSASLATYEDLEIIHIIAYKDKFYGF